MLSESKDEITIENENDQIVFKRDYRILKLIFGWVVFLIIVIYLILRNFHIVLLIVYGSGSIILIAVYKRFRSIHEDAFFILKKRFFTPFHYSILKKKYHVFTHKTVQQKALARYNQSNQPFFTVLIVYLANHAKYLQQLGPTAQQLIAKCKKIKYNMQNLSSVYDYYHYRTDELISLYIQGVPLSANLRERIVFEADMTDRHYLERELTSKDPLLIEIQKHDKIETPEFSILR
ncbi:hypothetical protein NEF87_000035 [Candidatus Lokiarchaeum ossiferum]|uniref:Uncharacterized protein n=1 Tax=Candidatus Lokiarchaeum ossiferum TaxID=2951803 RepID=A0ABY6HJQ0_9ARCH|nr:hypothetical protein NEF87_000035 [Candidatus Lokiarchaeum sp. B-35]